MDFFCVVNQGNPGVLLCMSPSGHHCPPCKSLQSCNGSQCPQNQTKKTTLAEVDYIESV